jgi:CHASE3 domain sensor protein
VTREVRDIYETAKDAKEVERRLRDLIDYMKWRSDETLSAYQHYFEQQRYADLRDDFHQRMHAEVQQYVHERQQRGRRGTSPQHKQKEAVSSLPAVVPQFDNEPDVGFLYHLAGEE